MSADEFDDQAFDAAHDEFGPDEPADDQHEQLHEQIKTQIISWSALAGRKAPPREFIMADWIPAHCVTLLHGFGGVGKTLLAQQIGTACVVQHEFLGVAPSGCPVLGWFGEDDHDEIWRRQENINAAFGLAQIGDLEGKLIWRPCPGDDISLFTASNESNFRTTELFEVLRIQLLEAAAKLTILDSATQIAAIPENNRTLVTRCLQTLNGLCIEVDTTIVLLGHNNRTGDYSGTSGWENRVRSRLHMKRDSDEDGNETIKLCRPKANYAALEEGVTLDWHEGAYRCTDHRYETHGDRLERKMRERQIDQAFLVALDKLTGQQRSTSHSQQARNYAPRLMVENGLANGFSRSDFEKAMHRLFSDDLIIADGALPWVKANRQFARGITRKQ